MSSLKSVCLWEIIRTSLRGNYDHHLPRSKAHAAFGCTKNTENLVSFLHVCDMKGRKVVERT